MMRRPTLCLLLGAALALAVAPAPAPAASDSGCPALSDQLLHQALYQAVQLQEKKDLAGAGKLLDDFAKKHPNRRHHQFSYMRGVLAYLAHQRQAADALFVQAVDLCPKFVPALRNLAVVRFELKRPLEAAALMLRAFKAGEGQQPDLLYQAAVMFLQGGKPGQALPHLLALAQRPAPKPDWLRALVQVHRDLGQLKKAALVLERLLLMQPGEASLWRLSASLLVGEKKYDRAAAALEVALRLEPPAQPSGWRQLAELLRASGVPQRAALYYRRSFGDQPTAKQWELLAKVYWEGNRFESALEATGRALKQEPNQARHLLAGRILLATGQYQAALDHLEKAGRAPGKAKVTSLLLAGYCAWQLDSLGRAEQAYGQALAQAPRKGAQARQAAQALESVRRLRAWRAAQSSAEPGSGDRLGG